MTRDNCHAAPSSHYKFGRIGPMPAVSTGIRVLPGGVLIILVLAFSHHGRFSSCPCCHWSGYVSWNHVFFFKQPYHTSVLSGQMCSFRSDVLRYPWLYIYPISTSILTLISSYF